MTRTDIPTNTTPPLQEQADQALTFANGAYRAAQAAVEVARVEEAKYLRLELQSIAERHPAVVAFGCECEFDQDHGYYFETKHLSVTVDETLPAADRACALGAAEEDVGGIDVSTEAAKLLFDCDDEKATLSLAALQSAEKLVSPSATVAFHPATEESG